MGAYVKPVTSVGVVQEMDADGAARGVLQGHFIGPVEEKFRHGLERLRMSPV